MFRCLDKSVFPDAHSALSYLLRIYTMRLTNVTIVSTILNSCMHLPASDVVCLKHLGKRSNLVPIFIGKGSVLFIVLASCVSDLQKVIF